MMENNFVRKGYKIILHAMQQFPITVYHFDFQTKPITHQCYEIKRMKNE